MNRPLAAVSFVATIAAVVVTVYVAGHHFIPQDATVERDVQATAWGPLLLTFPIFSWIGDAKGGILEAIVFALVLVFNRRAWLVAAGAAFTGVLYVVLSHVIIRARPTTAQVLQVTEHPAASSYPSGHTIFVVTLTVVLMLCFGYRFLPRWARPIGWTLVVLLIAANAIGRMYTGAHWPTDVLGGLLIAVAWITFWVALRPVSARAFTDDSRVKSRRRTSPIPT